MQLLVRWSMCWRTMPMNPATVCSSIDSTIDWWRLPRKIPIQMTPELNSYTFDSAVIFFQKDWKRRKRTCLNKEFRVKKNLCNASLDLYLFICISPERVSRGFIISPEIIKAIKFSFTIKFTGTRTYKNHKFNNS